MRIEADRCRVELHQIAQAKPVPVMRIVLASTRAAPLTVFARHREADDAGRWRNVGAASAFGIGDRYVNGRRVHEGGADNLWPAVLDVEHAHIVRRVPGKPVRREIEAVRISRAGAEVHRVLPRGDPVVSVLRKTFEHLARHLALDLPANALPGTSALFCRPIGWMTIGAFWPSCDRNQLNSAFRLAL